jgi:hypothetical protein
VRINQEAKYTEGQKVKIVALVGTDAYADMQLRRHVNKTGTVVKSYCVTRDEMPDLSKMFVYPDVYSYDVKLNVDGEVVRGIPEITLEAHIFHRS